MRFLKSFLKSKSEKKYNYINDVIDSELEVSIKFGLKLDEKTIKKGKEFVYNSITKTLGRY